MNDRLQDLLDGERSLRGVDQRELEAFASAEDLIRQVLSTIPLEPIPDLAPAVLQRIRAEQRAVGESAGRRTWWARVADWFWAPRPISIQWRPAYALALTVVIAVSAIFGRTVASAPVETQQVLVQFRLDAPHAGTVQLAGNFTNWKAAVAMKRTGAGAWTVVLPLPPGVHNYAFVIDGEQWVADPMAPAVSDGFGGVNSQLAVLTPDAGKAL
jgi:hypothetical protein